MKIQFDFNLK